MYLYNCSNNTEAYVAAATALPAEAGITALPAEAGITAIYAAAARVRQKPMSVVRRA